MPPRLRLSLAAACVATGITLSLLTEDSLTHRRPAPLLATEHRFDGRSAELNYDAVPFRDVIDDISRRSGARVVIDPAIHAEVGAGLSDRPITARLRDIRFRRALQACIEDADPKLELDYPDTGEVLITTARSNAHRALVRTYDVSDLYFDQNHVTDYEDLRNLIIETVSPESWSRDNDITATITNGRLIVRQTPQHLRLIEALLAQLFETRPDLTDVPLMTGSKR